MVQFNWNCERGGDNDEALTWGRGLINLFFPKYARFSRKLVDVFEKNEK